MERSHQTLRPLSSTHSTPTKVSQPHTPHHGLPVYPAPIHGRLLHGLWYRFRRDVSNTLPPAPENFGDGLRNLCPTSSFSAVSYQYFSPHDSGPAREVQTALRTPTCVAIAAGHGQGRWGIQVDDDEEAFRLIKLAVMHPEYHNDSFQDSGALEDARRIRRSYHRTPSDLIWQYLGKLWASSLEAAARHLGIPTQQMALLAQHVVIGIPTNWPSDAVTRLREAVKNAGISGGRTTVQFLSEPEAAILARFPRLPVAARPQVCPVSYHSSSSVFHHTSSLTVSRTSSSSAIAAVVQP